MGLEPITFQLQGGWPATATAPTYLFDHNN